MVNNTDYPNQLHDFLKENDKEEGKLFDYQRNVFNFMTKMNQRGILLYHSVGSGKCMAAGTRILMYDGSHKEIQKIKVGEFLMGDDSNPREVLSLASGTDQMFNVWYGNSKYTVNSDHVLCLKTKTYPYCFESRDSKTVFFLHEGKVNTKKFRKEECVVDFMDSCSEDVIHVTVKDYLSSPDLVFNARGYKAKVNFGSVKISTDPMFVGALHARSGNIIPKDYVINDHCVRERLLAGVLNVKGRVFKRKGFSAYSMKFIPSHKKLMNQVVFMLNTLGVLHHVKLAGEYFVVVYGRELSTIAKHMGALESYYGDESIDDGYKISIKPIGEGKYYGFTINGNRRYLLSDCTVTHNTMTSVSIAEHFKQLGRDIMVLSSKALQINYKKEIAKFRGDDNLESYSFITSNARNMIDKITNESKKGIDDMLNQINKKSLDNKVVIIDEAHNLFNSIVNGSAIANEFYDMVMNAKNLKLILMTGTPIINDPFELAICFNMIVGNMSNNRKKRTTILPEYYTDFVKYFVSPNRSGVKNEDKFRNRIFGLTSYYGDFYNTEINISKQLKQTESKENYPDRKPIKFEVVKMTELQSLHYLKARETEKLENSMRGSGIVKESSMSSTSYRIKSRQISNVYIPDTGVDDISKYSSKIERIVNNIVSTLDEPGTMLVYSTFLKYGIEAIAAELDKAGMGDSNSQAKYKYMIFSGQQNQEEKEQILSMFNSDANLNGDLVKLIMITKSGTEGLDLKNVRHLHITEPYWNFSLIQQVIARGVRYKSHSNLPEEFRNVQVYIYLSDYNAEALSELKERKAEIEKTTDIYMITNAISNQELIYKFLKTIASTSIECRYYNRKNINYDCYTCKPTGEKMYVEDIHTDMKTSNKCIKTKQVTAHEVVIDGNQYFYTDSFDIYQKRDGIYVKIEDDNIVSQVKSALV